MTSIIKGGGDHPRNLQYLQFDYKRKKYTIANVHGLWNGKGKTDTPERILQSEKIKKYIDSVNGEKILCGDFNLRTDTRSIEIIESSLQNLIKFYSIETTRTSLYTKPEKHADYIFTSKNLQIQDFKVLKDEVSDHSPLYLKF